MHRRTRRGGAKEGCSNSLHGLFGGGRKKMVRTRGRGRTRRGGLARSIDAATADVKVLHA